jgi:hypothetical protein
VSSNRNSDHFCFYHGDVKGFCYSRIRVSYEAEPVKMLRFFIPVPLTSLRQFANIQMGGTQKPGSPGRMEKDKWQELINCSLVKAKEQGLLERWIAPAKAVVVYTMYVKNRLRKVQNYALFAVNAALKDNGIIKDDDVFHTHYFVNAVLVSEKDSEGTGIAIIDMSDSDVNILNTSIKEICKI